MTLSVISYIIILLISNAILILCSWVALYMWYKMLKLNRKLVRIIGSMAEGLVDKAVVEELEKKWKEDGHEE